MDELLTMMARMVGRCIGGMVPRAERGSQGLAGLGQEAISIGSWKSPRKISSLADLNPMVCE